MNSQADLPEVDDAHPGHGGDGAVAVRLRPGFEPTPMQRSLIGSQRRHPTHPLQNMVRLTHLDGAVDADRLADAFAHVVASSDALRSRVVEVDGSARIEITADTPATEIIDLPRPEVSAWAARRAAQPIDLAAGCSDSVIVRHDDGTASWYLALHHAMTDATSSTAVFDATAAAYAGETIAPSDYYTWWRSQTADRRTQAAEAHWSRRSEAPRTGQLYGPVLRPTPVSHRRQVELSADLREQIRERLDGDLRAISDDLAWTILLVTVAAAYLHRLTGSTEFAIGLPVHNRTTATTRRLIGPLMEVFPVDVSVEADDTFRRLHRRVGRAVLATLRHARPGTAPSTSDCEAIVNVIVSAGPGSFGEIPATAESVHPGASDPNHLFRLQATTYAGELDLLVDLNDAATDEAQRGRAPGHITRLLRSFVRDPDRRIVDDTLCLPDELASVRRWGRGPDPGPTPPSIVMQLAASLADGGHVAVHDGDLALTGRELWGRVGALAVWLREQGVTGAAGSNRVGIEIERGLDAVVAIFATLVAGGSYVPLDPAQPADRRRRLAERSACVVVLDRVPTLEPLPPDSPIDVAEVAGDDEAYLLFTSGSTGEPKGVPISHAGLARYVQFALDAYVEPDVPPVAPLFSALTFDLTVTTLFVPLVARGRLVIVGAEGSEGLAQIAQRTDLTWCKATPSHLEVLLRLNPKSPLRTLIVGGEAFHARLARRLSRTFPDLRIFNEYGPTEAVVGCMIHEADLDEIGDAADVPIGRPAPGVSLRIVDRALADVPVGALGELLISHAGVTSGYLDDETTDDPFVHVDGIRWYRSGDLVRLADDSTLVYHGRIDEQIKTGGVRLEPVEVEAALAAHPAIERAAVRLWSPRPTVPSRHCVRCGLPSNVPGVEFDAAGVCATCHSYDRIKEQAAVYFRTPDDLRAIRDAARRNRTGRYDCLHLLSGGKDSTFALYQLVELGFEVRTMTLDNGFISDGAKDNVRRSVAELGVDHEFVTSEVMNEIFRDSLERHSNVCHGCYKTLYTLATTRADELGIPVIVTGLSRGQLFETRLVPQQFGSDRFDPDAIDRAVIEARRSYHRIDDGPNRLLDTSVFDADDVFDRISYVDFYRYVDVELAEMLSFLDRSAPWVRPADTGRSTNCLVNAAGIHTHVTEQGYHNYAIPYAWDVRLGHKTRQEAMDELDDDLDLQAVDEMLADVGYAPAPRTVLTAWFELAVDAVEPRPAELRSFLADRLPAFAVPSGFVVVDEIPMTSNGKLDTDRLPAPTRVHRSGPTLEVVSETELESAIVAAYERALQIEPVGVTDDFFDLGGDSLAALTLVVAISEQIGATIREELVFANTTPRRLAHAIDALDDGDAPETAAEEIPRRPSGSTPPVSALEQAMLFEYFDDPDDPRFNVGHLFRVHGEFDVQRFVDAVRMVVDRQPTLHWTYGAPRRRLSADDAFDVFVRSTPVAPEDLSAAVRRYHVQPIDLEAGPIGRCVIQPLTDGTSAVLLVVHHVAIDAAGFDILWNQIHRAYSGTADDAPSRDYADHAVWQQDRVAAADLPAWLYDADVDEVRFDRTIGAGDSTVGDVGAGEWGGGYLQRTASFSTAELRAGPGATPFATALAGLGVALRPHCAGDRVGIGLTVSTREHPAVETVIGLFLNTVPVVLPVTPGSTYTEVADAAGAAVAAALAARTIPLATIAAARRRTGLQPPAINVLLAFEDWAPCRLGSAPVDHEVLPTGSPVADATFFVQLHGDRVELSIEYRASVLDGAGAAQLLVDFERAIRAAIDRPRSEVAALDTGPTSSVVTGPDTAPVGGTLHDLIGEQVDRDPAHPAVRCGDETLTYGDLDGRSNRVAHELRSRGVGPGSVVGVIGHRHADTVIAILAVLKAGAAYVAIDPDYPNERITQMVDDAGLAVVLSGRRPADADDWAEDLPPLVVLGTPDLDRWPTTPPDVPVGSDDLAYLVYTSGSTGRPKAVMVRHRNIVASTSARSAVYPGDVERFLLLSSFSFDSSMVGLFWTLTTGGTVVLPAAGRHDDILEIAALVEQRRITHLLALPSLYRLVLAEADDRQLRSLRAVIVAGEACSYDVVERHRATCPDALLANEYGPSEGTVWSHVYLVEPSLDRDPVPIGSPIPGVAHVVLDETGRPAVDGAAGELCIGGLGIAAGYHGRPDLTAERFVDLGVDVVGAHPGPWYRTGDRVRADDHGRLVFLGRVDDQIKVRGVRVEPAEVESALRSCRGVGDVAVGLAVIGGREQLVAWYVPTDDRATAALRAELAGMLPDQLVPSRFVAVDALPLGANGKLDRQALPAPDGIGPGDPATPAVADSSGDGRVDVLAGIWAEVLGLDHVGPDDNFFDLGGDSIISLQIVARARRRGVDLRPRQVFEHQTVRELADAAGFGVSADRPAASGGVGLTPIQRWFFEQEHERPDHWNQTLDLGLGPDTDLDVLFAALDDVRMRHEQLRCRFDVRQRPPLQEILDTPAPVVRRDIDLDDEDPVHEGEAVADIEASLDLAGGRLVGVLVCRRSARPERVVVTIHHLVVDGVSWSTIIEDWAAAYASRSAGRAPTLPDRSASFQQWARALESAAADDRYAATRSYWRTDMGTVDDEVVLRRSDANTEGAARSERRSIDRDRTERLLGLAGGGDMAPSVEDILLTALALTIPTRSSHGRLAVVLEGHGREELDGPPIDVSRTVGWFTSLYPVVLGVGRDSDPAEAIRTVAEQLRAIPDRGLGYGVDRHLGDDDGTLDQELPVVAFNYLGQLDRVMRAVAPFTTVGELRGSNAPVNRRGHLLGVLAVVRDGELSIMLEYLPEHVDAGAAAGLADDLANTVRRLVDSVAEATPSGPAFDLLDQSDADAAQLGALLDQFD